MLKVVTRPCFNGHVPHGVLDTLSHQRPEGTELKVTARALHLFDYRQSLALVSVRNKGSYVPLGPTRKGGHLFLTQTGQPQY